MKKTKATPEGNDNRIRSAAVSLGQQGLTERID